MIYAQNNLVIRDATYSQAQTFNPGIGPAAKITVINLSTTPVILLIGEYGGEGAPPEWGDQGTAEMQIDPGFSSIVPVTPIAGWRFRIPAGGSAVTLHYRVYA